MRENQSIGKAVAVLREVSQHPNGVSASELSRRTAISRVTVARLAATLAQHHMLTRRSDDRYILGSEVARLGSLANHDQLVIAAVEPGLRALRDTFDEAATLEVPRGAHRIETVYQLNPSYVMTPNWVGQDIDLHASSAGKVFLAFSQPSPEKALSKQKLVARTRHTITELPAAARAPVGGSPAGGGQDPRRVRARAHRGVGAGARRQRLGRASGDPERDGAHVAARAAAE